MELKNKKISIIGAVRSGLAAAKLAGRNGITPFVSDFSSYEKLKDNFDELAEIGIEFEYGGHTDKVYDADLIVTSPGVPSNSVVLQNAIKKGIPVISELEFAFYFCRGKIIGITGTNGKTTTTALCGHTLNYCGFKTYVAGNIGSAFSEIADKVGENEFVALEISSFQLDYVVKFAPYIAVLLNITPDHLDRYDGDIGKYASAKFKITGNQTADDYFIINAADAQKYNVDSKAELLLIDTNKAVDNGAYCDSGKLNFVINGNVNYVCDWDDVNLKGEHNLQNTLAVLSAAKLLNAENEKIKEAFSTFAGVEHRLEFVRRLTGVTFINDSKATNVDSVYYALKSFDKPIRLILGGKDKGNDYSRLLDLIKKHVIKIYAIGSSAEKVFNYFVEHLEVEKCGSLEDAVNLSFKEASPQDVVLLSPACASFDMFDNYERRGEVFKKLVNEL